MYLLDEVQLDAGDDAIFNEVDAELAAAAEKAPVAAAAPVEPAQVAEVAAPVGPEQPVAGAASTPDVPKPVAGDNQAVAEQPAWDPKSVASYEGIIEAMPHMPEPIRAAVEHVVQLLEPHYDAIIQAEDAAKTALADATAQKQQWDNLLADARTRGVEVVSAEQVKQLGDKVAEKERVIAGYHLAYSRLTNDSFVMTTPSFSASHRLASFFFAAVERGLHRKKGTDADSEARQMHLLWNEMTASSGEQSRPSQPAATATTPNTAAPAQPQRPSPHAAVAATAVSRRPAASAVVVKDYSKMTDKEILDEVDTQYRALNLRS